MSRPALSRSVLAFYALPAFVLAMPTIPLFVYLPTFYAQGLGVGLAATGTALLAARIFDVLTDPLVGILSDRVRSRWGRRKPWIAAGGLIAAIALVQLFDPPASAGPMHLGLWAVLLYLGWTLVAVPYAAWAAELSPDYHERARITGAREAASILGVLIAGAAPAVAVLLGGGEAQGLAAIAWITVALGLPAVWMMLARVPDQVPTASFEPPPPLRVRLAAIARNRPFLRLLAAWFVNGLANGLPAVLFPLYLEYVLRAGPLARGGLIMTYFLCGIIAIPLWVRLSRRFGKHRVWCWAMLLSCAAFVWVPFLQKDDLAAFAVACVVTGFALGADLALPPAMQADVVDLDTLRTREERAGLFFALSSMSTKLALATAVGIAFPAIEALGFVPAPGNPAEALLALALLYAAVPTVLKLVAVALIWKHPMTVARQAVIRRRLEQRASRRWTPADA